MLTKTIIGLFVLSTSFLSVAFGAPAVAYTDAPKFDSSNNEDVYRQGVVPFEARYGRILTEARPESPYHYTLVLRELAIAGHSPIVAIGQTYAPALQEVAPEFPNTQFTLIDAVVNLPNVQSVLFRSEEGSFLVGALAALTTEGDDFGFIGGTKLPIIQQFVCGYAQGVKYINEDANVHSWMIASDLSGFASPQKGGELASGMMDQGVEVIYVAAAASAVGVYDAAGDRPGVYTIGIGTNQNFLEVGTMLTTMVKNTGLAAYNAFEEGQLNEWQPGIKVLGLEEEGVDWAVDIFNRNLVPIKIEERINKIRNDIIRGRINVTDYLSNNSCPVTLQERQF